MSAPAIGAPPIGELYRAMLAHDIAALDDLLAETCIYIHSTGLAENKQAFLAGVRDGLYEYEIVRPISEQFFLSGELAAIYSVLDFQGGPRGQPHPRVRLLTSLIWTRHGDAWRLGLRQATRVP
jgi:Domain of unknown function (DUF4440)